MFALEKKRALQLTDEPKRAHVINTRKETS
jgi:hypothetical protein